eukprot:m51a1_g1678 hypothetical protein (447) ;mRNA; r:422509-425477
MRFHALLALFVVVACAAAVACATFSAASASQLRKLERRQAFDESALFHGNFDSVLANLQSQIVNVAWWNDLYDFMVQQDPNGGMWSLFYGGLELLTLYDLQALFLVLPNGTLLNGFMWDANGTSKAPASPSLCEQVGGQLVAKGKATGLYWIPETSTPVIIQTEYVKHADMYGDDVGWIAFARDARNPLSRIAETADLCASLLTSIDGFSSIASTHDTYLAIGTVLNDELGVPRAYVLIRGNRVDAPTIASTSAFLMIICCVCLFVLLCLIALLLEFFVIRILASLSRKIVSVSSDVNSGKRLKVTGKSELRNVTRAVNELLASLERRTEQTEHVMRNTFPHVVLARIRRDESNNLTYPNTSVLFVDICNFTLWFVALYFTDGVVWNVQGIDGAAYFKANGTLVNSGGYNYPMQSTRNLSATEIRIMHEHVLKQGEFSGLIWDPET